MFQHRLMCYLILKSVKINGVSVEVTSNTVKIDQVTSTTTIDVEYKDIVIDDGNDDNNDDDGKVEEEVKVKVNVNIRNGEYTLDKQEYKVGENALITFKADEGYELFSIMVDGTYVDDSEIENIISNGLTIENLTKDVDVVVMFTKIQESETPATSKGCNGSMSASIIGMLLVGISTILFRKKREE